MTGGPSGGRPEVAADHKTERTIMVAQQKIKDSSEFNPSSPKSRLAVASMLKRSNGKAKLNNTPLSNDPFRFQGEGVDCKGKLIGERDVSGPKGDAMCAEAMRLAKAAIKSAGAHKQRIVLNISVEGLKIKEEKSGAVLYSFPVSKISFIARDTTDARAFGFIFGSPQGYKFYGIKTAQTADNAVFLIRDMFQVVFEMKKKQVQEAKQKQVEHENAENSRREEVKGFRVEEGVPVGDLLDLETELQNIEQGFHQLENIPSMPEDQLAWPTHGEAFSTNDPFNSTTASSVVDPFNVSFATPQNGHHQNNFWSQRTTTTVLQSSTNPFMQPAANGLGGQPAAIQRPVASLNSSPYGLPPPPQRTPAAFELNGLGSAGSSLNGQHSPPENNWGTSSASSKENEPTNGHVFQADFTKHTTVETTLAPAAPKNISLEDAFSKLVDMNALVDPTARKTANPFEHLINPPQLPLSAIPSSFQQKNPMLQPTAVSSDPFSNDPFFQ
ncbi:Protein disabled [Aphelenchoides fujianensis]|nr:Protein disabled [Aphelenchoides fujianensis]